MEVQKVSFKNSTRESQFDLVSLEELLKRKDLSHQPDDFHQVDFYLVLFFTNGNGIHTCDFTDYTFQKNTIITIRKNQIHKFSNSDAKGYLLLFTSDFLIQFITKKQTTRTLQLFNELILSPKTQLSNKQGSDFQELIHKIASEYNNKDEFSLSNLGSYLLIFLNNLFRAKQTNPSETFAKKYLKEFIEFQKLVENQCFETKKVSDYAEQLLVSAKTLNNITRAIMNKSAKEFIDDMAITQIKRLLLNTRMNVKEIAYQSGFSEPTNFYKFFKKHTNFTPDVYRDKFH